MRVKSATVLFGKCLQTREVREATSWAFFLRATVCLHTWGGPEEQGRGDSVRAVLRSDGFKVSLDVSGLHVLGLSSYGRTICQE